MKTRNDFRSQFNTEKQLPVFETLSGGTIIFTPDYVHWLEDLVMKDANEKMQKQFNITFRHTDNTDASLHEEIVSAETSEDALNILYRKHKFHIEWNTIKELHF